MNGYDLQEFLRRVYCRIDFDRLKEFYGINAHESYMLEKWNSFRADFSNWFLNLDGDHAERFIDFVNSIT